ncbi:MAG: carboxypeptidase, partial [bacterium]|nr:carboxypeptidase [bacterium]
MKNQLIYSLFFLLLLAGLAGADEDLLPPIKPWNGRSESLIVPSSHPWQTPAETTGLTDSPDYAATVKYLTRLVNSEKRFVMTSIGKSPLGRDILMVIASKEGARTASELKDNRKPTLLVQAGIHSGEIDGKDAGMMLLRDISKGGKGPLLDNVNLLFIPIFSVDGHERRAPFHRANQRGPKNMGWRTTAQNLNLNRDYSKADTPEMQHLLRAFNHWQPDLYFDVHVTDGEDYQYDVTYGFNRDYAYSPNISRWLSTFLRPSVDRALSQWGHKGGPLVWGIHRQDFSKGIVGWTAPPRFSNGYGDLRHLPTVLVENHSLKPFRQRVLGTYIFIEQSLKVLAREGKKLMAATKKDKAARPGKLILSWNSDKEKPERMDFAGIGYRLKKDPLTGLEYIAWNGEPKQYPNFPIFWQSKPEIVVNVPKAYYIPAQHHTVIQRLAIHGIQLERLKQGKMIKAQQLTAGDFKFVSAPFEGHFTVEAVFDVASVEVEVGQGTVKVSTHQPLGRLAVALLDPRGPDSFFRWGFFNQMFQQAEYMETYAMVPLAKKML